MIGLEAIRSALAGRYTIERELGAGGMATVYLAEDLKHHRRVAIKVLRPELAAALGTERFLREIAIAARLHHPHILPLYDSGDAAGLLYYSMPFVEGESLRDRLNREKQLPLDDALQIAREVADALSAAHSHDVVHRDIKPENILLESGHAMVADFGIARAITVASGEQLTETGVTIGTAAYMSPEQVAGSRDLDGRSDVYSLACVLYEMLAGQPPFTGATREVVAHQHLTAPARAITDIRPSVPVDIAAVLARALAKTPADRFHPVARFAEALQRTPAAAIGPARSQPGPRVAALVGLLVLLTFGIVLWRRAAAPALQLGRRTQVTLDPGLELDPALSPDGRLVAYSGPQGAITVRQTEGGSPIAVVREGGGSGSGAGRWPAWVPDGRRIVFLSPRGIEIVPALGGEPRLLVAGPALAHGVAVAPDGRTFAFAAHDSIYAEPLEGGAPRFVSVGWEVHSLAWSPDGRWIAYVSGNVQYVTSTDLGNAGHSSIWVAPAAGGTPRQVTDQESLNVSPAWTADGALLFVSDRDGGRDVYEVRLQRNGSAARAPVGLTTGLNIHGISVSQDGTHLAYSAFTETSNVWSLALPATGAVSVARATPVTIGNQTIENLAISPDGRWLAFESDRGGPDQVFRVRLDGGGEPAPLTADSAGSFWPSWSPSGRELAYHAFRGERRQVFVMAAEGGPAIQVTDNSADERLPEWSPDGRRLLLLSNYGTSPILRIVTRGTDGRWSAPEPFNFVVAGDTARPGNGAWSPDGRWIVCGCGRGGLVLAPANGGPARRLASPFPTTGWSFPQWSADGRTVYHLSEDSGRVRNVVAVPLSGGAARAVIRFDDPTRPWHRYGFRVINGRAYFTLGDLQSDIWVAEVRRP